MKQINFLPISYQENKAKRKAVPYLVTAVILAGALLSGIWFFWHTELGSLNAQLADEQLLTQNKIISLQTNGSTLLDKQSVTRLALLNQATKTEVDWSLVFANMAKVVPQDERITSVSYALSGSGDVAVTLNGKAPSNLSFAIFVQSLQDNTRLINPTVTSYVFNPGDASVSFAITYSQRAEDTHYLTNTSK